MNLVFLPVTRPFHIDTQKTEIIGRNRLVNELLEAGLEVATPIRDRGVDLIAYLDIDDETDRFVAFPIQLKVSTDRRFSVMRKYNRFPNLIIAHVWGIGGVSEPVTYALTQQESVLIAETMKWTATASWANGGYHSVMTKKLSPLLEPYLMTTIAWRAKLLSMI